MAGLGNFFSADSTTTAEDSRLAVTDQGSGQRGTGNTILHSGSVDLRQARVQAAPIYSGIRADKGSTINITEGGGGNTDQIVGLLSSFFSSQAQAQAIQSTPPATNGIGISDGTPDSGSGTDGLPPPARNPVEQNTGLSIWVVLGVLAAVIFFLVKK